MLVQLQVQSHIHYSGPPCIQGQRQQEEAHRESPQTREAAAPVKDTVKVINRQEEALGQEEAMGQEEALGQEEQDHLHQEEGME